MIIGTYNMQGSNLPLESKWTNIPSLVGNRGVQYLVLLQECGHKPEGATDRMFEDIDGIIQKNKRYNRINKRISIHIINERDKDANATLCGYNWNVGTQSRPDPHYIIHVPWSAKDGGNERCSLGILLKAPLFPEEIVVIYPSNPFQDKSIGRPALGVKIGKIYFFTIHAISRGGGADIPYLMESIGKFVTNGSDCIVGGDFNHEPKNPFKNYNFSPPWTTLVVGQEGTQESGHVLDFVNYMGRINLDPLEIRQAQSDHKLVKFWLR